MRKALILAAVLPLVASPAYTGEAPPKQPMSFFVTSVGMDGGNLGGLAGADGHCGKLAAAAGAVKKQWRAYLSTQGAGAVNARDRIGKGPWFDFNGVRVAADLADLHGDTLELARKSNNINKRTALSEKGVMITSGWDGGPNRHDILTGSQMDGTAFTDAADHTCKNWTSNAADGRAQIGHHDRASGSNISWNSAHPTSGCTAENLKSTGGDGLLYCFAVD